MSARETLAGMRAIEQAATEGPWGTGNYWGALTHGPDGILGAYYEGDCPACDESLDAEAEVVIEGVDLDFIAASRSFVPKALAALDAVLAMHAPSKEPTSGHYYCDSDECDRAGEGELRDACQHCGHWFPCPTTAAIEQALS